MGEPLAATPLWQYLVAARNGIQRWQMVDLKVEYDRLEESSSQLDKIKSTFDGLEGSVDDASDAWGDDQVSGAMHTFATNWGYHRKKLSNKIHDGREKIEKTLTSFEKADKQLAHAVEGSVKVDK